MKTDRPIPPPLAQRFLRWFIKDELAEEVFGDLEEQYDAVLESRSSFQAKLNYWYQVFHYLRPFAIRKLNVIYLKPYAMYRSYFKMGWRNLLKYKAHSVINTGGLAVGMAVAMLIGLWLYDELSFNSYHDNYYRIARVMQNQLINGKIETWNSQAMQLGPAIRTSYGSNFQHIVLSSFTGGHILAYEEKVLTKTGNFMEPHAPELLTLHMLEGSRSGLNDLHSILLSESVAKAFFGEEDPMGKVLKIDNKLEVSVTGVYEDLPFNSSFSDLSFIAPWDLMVKSQNLEERVGWGNNWFQVLVQVAEHVEMGRASAAIKNVKLDNLSEEEAKFKPELFLHPMPQWHLYSTFENGVSVGGRIQMVRLVGIIGGIVLLLACINFVNLSTARAEKRAKEVGVRKVVGSKRSQLISQFFSESLLVVVLAFVFSLLLVQLMLPWFNEVADKQIAILWANPLFWLFSLVFVFLTGLMAGSYPAFFLSSFSPIKVLKGSNGFETLRKTSFWLGRFHSLPRKILVIVQFTVSVILIIGTIIVYQQIQFAKNRPVGYERNGLITIPMKTDEVFDHFEVLRNDLLATGVVSAVALSESPITNTWVTNSGFEWKGKDPNMQDEIVTVGITHDFGKVVGWEVIEGRDFSLDFSTDSSGFILNETAVKYMGFDNPIGQTVRAFGRVYTVIGVVKDMVTQSLYQPVKQTIFYIDTYHRVGIINLKISPQVSASIALAEIEPIFKKHNPATPFEYNFADEEFAQKFAYEARIGKLAGFFAVLAIFISSLGLFGMASFVAEQRTKEIGIRKILGASVVHLWQMLSTDFVVLVMVSCLIAVPVAYYGLHQWLQQYSYRTDIAWWVFAVAGLSALLITLLTVSYQTTKAALRNPVESLRSE